MFLYLFTFLIILLCGNFVYKHSILLKNCTKVRNCRVMCNLGSVLCRTSWQLFLQTWVYKHVKKIYKNTYQIECVMNGKLHTFICKVPRGPSKILQISDKQSNDVTQTIESRINAQQVVWEPANPNELGFTELHIETTDGDSLEFKDADDIIL